MKYRIFYEFVLIFSELLSSNIQIPEALEIITR